MNVHTKIKYGPYKYTVEEVNGNEFISTFWDKDHCLEEDRYVKKFETLSGALVHMYRAALIDNCPLVDME